MLTLTLPQLVAGRDLADSAVARLGTVTGADVVVDARPLVSGTASFAAQLVARILREGSAQSLTITGGPADFSAYAEDAAGKLGVAERLHTGSALPAAS